MGGTGARNLSHADEFILLAQITSERRVSIQINEVHRAAEQVADACSNAVEDRRRQTADGKVEVGVRAQDALGRGAEDIHFAGASGFEFRGGVLNQCTDVPLSVSTCVHPWLRKRG
jgi:hypothetical protein